ncbi:MAG TPA: YfjI family protein, partial [Novosphingobium sp.]|nr:YfjI family protein [Novosphingobium sp.]
MGADASPDWPEPLPLNDELPAVLPFDPAMLPSQLAPWVIDIAERMNCPLDMVAVPAMIAAGSLVGRRIAIRPQRQTDWQEAGNLWGAVVAPPGHMKSPAASEALKPLRRLESQAALANARAQEQFRLAEALHKVQSRDAETEAKKRLKEGSHDAAMAALRAAQPPELPPERRYLANDATAEKLGEMCAANPFGLMVHRDELLTLFADLDQSEKATARGFFMVGWGGQEGYTFDRIGRGTVRVSTVNISLFGTTQPTRLAGYVRESLRRFDDGLVQRLQLLAWPDFSGEYREVDRYPNSTARQQAYACFDDLAALNVNEIGAERDTYAGDDGVPFLRFAPAAQEAFCTWRAELERKARGDDLAPALSSHLAKYRGLIPRLALVCHLAGNGLGPVSMAAANQSFAWAAYLESHARRVYA